MGCMGRKKSGHSMGHMGADHSMGCMGCMGCRMSAGCCMGCMGCMGCCMRHALESHGLLLSGNMCSLGMSSDDGQGSSGATPMHSRRAAAPGPAAGDSACSSSSSPVEVAVPACCSRRQMGGGQGDSDVRCRLVEPRGDEELGHRLGLGGKAIGGGGRE